MLNAVGFGLAMGGMGGGAWLSGAAVVGWFMLLSGLAVLLTVMLFALEWVGTGGDEIEAPTTGRLVLRAGGLLLALGVLAGALAGAGGSLPDAAVVAADAPDAAQVGADLFARHPAAVAGVGLLLLVGVLAVVVRQNGERG